METIQINIPQDSSTKSGEYELNFENRADVFDLLIKSSNEKGILAIYDFKSGEKPNPEVQPDLYESYFLKEMSRPTTSLLTDKVNTAYSGLTYSIRTLEKREETDVDIQLDLYKRFFLKKMNRLATSLLTDRVNTVYSSLT